MASMRATIFNAPGDVTVEDRQLPEPGPRELRMAVAAASLCASDVRVYRGEKHADAGVIPGHEIAGVIDAVGDGVEGFAEGDRVIICPILACGHCRYCLIGKRNRCVSRRTLGYDLDGGFAQHLLIPEELVSLGHVMKMPDHLPMDVAALTEPTACTLNSIELCEVVPGTSLAIVGAGPMGLLHLLLARAAGAAPIIVSEPIAERREIASHWGADLVLDPESDDVPAATRGITDGYGADAVVLTVGVPALVQPSLDLVRKQGIVNLFAGFPAGSDPVPFDPNFIHYSEVVLSGSQNATTDQYRRTLAMIGTIEHMADVATNRYDIEHAPDAYTARLAMNGLKSLVEFPGVDAV